MFRNFLINSIIGRGTVLGLSLVRETLELEWYLSASLFEVPNNEDDFDI